MIGKLTKWPIETFLRHFTGVKQMCLVYNQWNFVDLRHFVPPLIINCQMLTTPKTNLSSKLSFFHHTKIYYGICISNLPFPVTHLFSESKASSLRLVQPLRDAILNNNQNMWIDFKYLKIYRKQHNKK